MITPPNDKTTSAHHTVPKFYLKGFKDDEGHITVWNRNTGSLRKKALRYTSVTRGYYTVLDKNKSESDMVEDFYSHIESAAKPVFEKMTCVFSQTPAYNSEERTSLSIYLASQFFRTKQVRRKSQLLYDYIFKLQELVSLSNKKEPLTQKQINFLSNPHIMGELKQPQDIYIKHELEMAHESIPLFYNRQWTIVEFNKPRLITSDTPIVLVPRGNHCPVGLATAPEFWFPIDNRHLLILGEPLRPYAFSRNRTINYSNIESNFLGIASLYDMANSLQLQNCCVEAYGEKELLKKYENFSLPARKPFITSSTTKLDAYYTNANLDWEPISGHEIETIDLRDRPNSLY